MLEQNRETFKLKEKTSYFLRDKDSKDLVYEDFAEFSISGTVLHTKGKICFLIEKKGKDSATWASADFMLDNHRHVAGPKQAMFTGMIYYI